MFLCGGKKGVGGRSRNYHLGKPLLGEFRVLLMDYL